MRDDTASRPRRANHYIAMWNFLPVSTRRHPLATARLVPLDAKPVLYLCQLGLPRQRAAFSPLADGVAYGACGAAGSSAAAERQWHSAIFTSGEKRQMRRHLRHAVDQSMVLVAMGIGPKTAAVVGLAVVERDRACAARGERAHTRSVGVGTDEAGGGSASKRANNASGSPPR